MIEIQKEGKGKKREWKIDSEIPQNITEADRNKSK